MPDNPPISTEAPETVTVDLGVDKEQLGDLNKTFDDFWAEEDSKESPAISAPEAPTEGPAQETKESKLPEPKPEPKKQPEPKSTPETTALAKELTDEEINKLELPPNARPELVEQFKKIKENWFADRARARDLAKEREALNQQLAEARQNAWTPETKADYEHAAAVRRRFDFVSDPEFIQRYHVPVQAQYEAILDEAVGMLPNQELAAQWAQYMKQNFHPDQLNRDWWVQSVLNKVPDELNRSSLRDSVTELLKLQKDRDSEITRRTSDRSSFDNWIQEKTQFTQQRVQQEIMAEIGEQEKRIAEVLPRDAAQAKTADERRAIEAHNERFTKLNNFFQNTMKDISANGPRAWVRASVEATRAMLLEGEYKELESELKSVKAERDQLRSELDKITGARRKITHTTGTPPGSAEKKPNSGLSVRDLDVRKAFDQFDWGDRT